MGVEYHPRDPYALSKHCIEVTADGFGCQSDSLASVSLGLDDSRNRVDRSQGDRSLAALSDEDVKLTRDKLFAYIHIGVDATIARVVIEEHFRGHERFWAITDDTTASAPTVVRQTGGDRLNRKHSPSTRLATDVYGTE